MEVREGLGHIHPELSNILCGQEARGRDDLIGTRCGINFCRVRGRNTGHCRQHRDGYETENQPEKQKNRIWQFITAALNPT